MKKTVWERVLFNISRFVAFFLVICLVTTVTILLFLKGITLDESAVRRNAPITFLCILLMTLIGCGLDAFRRNRTVDRPLKHILDTLEQLSKGDFSVRLDSGHGDFSKTGFDAISREINILAGELSGVETLRNDFIASVSHELKTPLAAIQNYAALLRVPGLPEEDREEYTQAILQTTRRLADMVSNILKLNKLENQQIFPEVRTFDLGEQLCACMLEYESLWEEKGLELECEIADGVQVRADPELLRLVWSNLFSNAVKFTPPGGRISLKLTTDGGWTVVSVSDTGCGMSKETGAHIFEKFYQGDTAHAAQGNGLGLALVKRVVDITGGVISVSSTPGKGATFTVRLRKE
ncbi:MAG: HAMP domain-containing sensor histidine kinase [Eubacteriales bacterium]|nr:HAMP domain-containing sensor histidine kinase [Eubacteriales bacterium]